MSEIVKSITLDLGKKEVTLTLKQAQALKKALDEMFGVTETVYTQPWVWRRDPPWWQERYYCSADTITAGSTQNFSASISDGNMTLCVA